LNKGFKISHLKFAGANRTSKLLKLVCTTSVSDPDSLIPDPDPIF